MKRRMSREVNAPKRMGFSSEHLSAGKQNRDLRMFAGFS